MAPPAVHTPSGHRVLVGRSARENTRITAAMAGCHLWFHVAGLAGPHVVLELPKGAVATPEDIACCERLARGRWPPGTAVERCLGTEVEADARRGPPGLALVTRCRPVVKA